MSNLSTKLTDAEIKLLQKFGIDTHSENLKNEIEDILAKSNQDEKYKILLLNESNKEFIEKKLLFDTVKYLPPNTDSKTKELVIQNYCTTILENNKNPKNSDFITFGVEKNSEIVATVSLITKDSDKNPSPLLTIKKNAENFELDLLNTKEIIQSVSEWIFDNFNYKYFYYGANTNSQPLSEIFQNFAFETSVENHQFDYNNKKHEYEVLKIKNPNYELKNKTQDKNWIINHLGWIDVKPIFANSNFKVFADLCEDQEIKSMLNTDKEEGNKKLLESIFRERSERPETMVLFVNENFDTIITQMIDLDRLVNKNQNFDTTTLAEDFLRKPKSYIKSYQKIIDAQTDAILPEFSNIKKISIFKYGELFNSIGISNCNLLILQVENSKVEQSFSETLNNPLTYWEQGCLDVGKYFKNNKNKNSRVQALVIKNGMDKFSRSDLDKIQDLGRSFGLPGIAYIQFEKGENQELIAKSPILKFFGDENMQKIKQQEIQDFLGIEVGDLVLFVAHTDKDLIHKAQNAIRKHIATKLDLINQNILKFVWIYDFPFFENGDKGVDFCHNPFSSWQTWDGLTQLETLQKAKKENRLVELLANQYDITCNGYEISSGGVRNTNPEAIMQAFQAVGYEKGEIRTRFGHMLEAYQFGAPNHAGFAPGLDRILMILTGEDNIRETIAFPKNGSGMDLMTNSPSTVDKSLLKDLGIKLLE